MRLALIALVLAADAVALPAPPAPVTITKHFTAADQVSGRYQYVPFDVPPGTVMLRISYDYDRANGDNVVDLGLFEPGRVDLGTPMRGYSGGAKTSVEVGINTSSAGYQRGPLPPGQWHALLGLYKVGAKGVDVRLTIATDQSTAAWYKGALHTHTLHSDGTVTPAELIRRFRAADFDFVAITDHNNLTHMDDGELAAEVARAARPIVIDGEEVTTPGGHANVWGLPRNAWIDFRVAPGDPRIRHLVAAATKLGAVFSVNHPASTCVACGWEHEWVEGISGLEISNGRHGEVDNALKIWDTLLVSGRHITGIGSSDWHSDPNPIDVANSRVYAERLGPQEILDAIKAGHVIVMNSGSAPTPELTFSVGGHTAIPGDTLTLPLSGSLQIDIARGLPNGKLVAVQNGALVPLAVLSPTGSGRVNMPVSPGYIRVEIRTADGGLYAAANPIYLRRP